MKGFSLFVLTSLIQSIHSWWTVTVFYDMLHTVPPPHRKTYCFLDQRYTSACQIIWTEWAIGKASLFLKRFDMKYLAEGTRWSEKLICENKQKMNKMPKFTCIVTQFLLAWWSWKVMLIEDSAVVTFFYEVRNLDCPGKNLAARNCNIVSYVSYIKAKLVA